MRNWLIVTAVAVILGLATFPFTGWAHAEEVGEGNQETHQAGDHPPAHKNVKKATKASGETKKPDPPAAAETNEQPHDGQGVHGSSLDDLEGSH